MLRQIDAQSVGDCEVMAPNNQRTPSPKGKRRKGLGIPSQLINMATPLRSATMQQLIQKSLPAFSRSITLQGKPVIGNRSTDLSGWMRSIRAKAKAALEQDDSMEAETELEIERSRQEDDFLDEPESAPSTKSFEQLGQLLEQHTKKRSFGLFQNQIVTPFEKRQKLNQVGLLYLSCHVANYTFRPLERFLRSGC